MSNKIIFTPSGIVIATPMTIGIIPNDSSSNDDVRILFKATIASIQSFDCSPDKRFLIFGDFNGNLYQIDIQTAIHETLLQPGQSIIGAISALYYPIIIYCGYHIINIWDMRDNSYRHQFIQPEGYSIKAILAIKDNQFITIGLLRFEGTIAVWDLEAKFHFEEHIVNIWKGENDHNIAHSDQLLVMITRLEYFNYLILNSNLILKNYYTKDRITNSVAVQRETCAVGYQNGTVQIFELDSETLHEKVLFSAFDTRIVILEFLEDVSDTPLIVASETQLAIFSQLGEQIALFPESFIDIMVIACRKIPSQGTIQIIVSANRSDFHILTFFQDKQSFADDYITYIL